MYQQILVTLDGSGLAEAALAHARAFAQCQGASLVLLRVVTYPLRSVVRLDPTFSGTLTGDLIELRQQAEAYLEGVAEKLKQDGFAVRTLVVDDPSPADAILDQAQAEHADLIVMSTHGRSGVTRWLLGSVADRVVHHAPVPVLLVRPAAARALAR